MVVLATPTHARHLRTKQTFQAPTSYAIQLLYVHFISHRLYNITAGIASPIRKTRGEDIMAACGQLKSASELKKGQKVTLK
jgi:hypothetical protein